MSLLYATDGINLLILFFSYRRIAQDISKSKYLMLYGAVFFLILLTLAGLIMNMQSPLLYLWGFRNTYRFFVFFFACAVTLRKSDVYQILDCLGYLLPINVILCSYQYFSLSRTGDQFVQKFLGDFIGGVFSTYQGVNRIMNVYLMFIAVWCLSRFLCQKLSLGKLTLTLCAVFYIAILAEIKLIFFEFAVSVFLAILITKKQVSRMAYILFGCILVWVVLSVWSYFDPDSKELMTSLLNIIQYSSASTYGAGSLNRFTAIPEMDKLVFGEDILSRLFGIGLGNADTSSVQLLVSSIYSKYHYLKYNYFMHAMLYLETGIIGLISYCMFFIILLWFAVKRVLKGIHEEDQPTVLASAVFTVTAVVCIFYNTTLRNETSGYLVFFFLAIPLIWRNNNTEQCERRRRVRLILK